MDSRRSINMVNSGFSHKGPEGSGNELSCEAGFNIHYPVSQRFIKCCAL